MSWPSQGDATTFRRRALVLGAIATLALAVPLLLAAWQAPQVVRPALPLALGSALLAGLWIHGAARDVARRAELERSFAGLVVLHHGAAYRVAEHPVVGAYATRRQAATAALDRGGWAIVVRAWDRCWLLDVAPVADTAAGDRTPVSFRSRAVADVIPAIA